MVNAKTNHKKTKIIKEMNQSEYAIHRGVSRPAVTRWKKNGLLVLTISGAIDVNKTDENIDNLVNTHSPKDVNKSKIKSVNKRSPPKKKKSGSKTNEEAKPAFDPSIDIEVKYEMLDGLRALLDKAGLLTKFQAEQVKENYLAYIRKLEAEQKAGKLVEVEPLKKQIFELFRRERDALLNLPSRISAVIAASLSVDQGELTILLEKQINDFLQERSDQPRIRFS